MGKGQSWKAWVWGCQASTRGREDLGWEVGQLTWDHFIKVLNAKRVSEVRLGDHRKFYH